MSKIRPASLEKGWDMGCKYQYQGQAYCIFETVYIGIKII